MNNTNNYRIIPTGLCSKVAYETLSSVLGQLSDGWGENSPANEKWWKFARIEQQPNNEVVIKILDASYMYDSYCNRYRDNGFYDMTDAEVEAKFAYWIKKTVQMELKDNSKPDAWKRDNDFELGYLGYNEKITVATAYYIYEYLNRRTNFARKYDESIVNLVQGEVATANEIAAEVAKRKAAEDKAAKYTADRAEIDAWEKSEIERIKKEAEEKRSTLWKSYKAA